MRRTSPLFFNASRSITRTGVAGYGEPSSIGITQPDLARRRYNGIVSSARHYPPSICPDRTDHTYSEKRFVIYPLSNGQRDLVPLRRVLMEGLSVDANYVDIASLNTMKQQRILEDGTSNSAWLKGESIEAYEERTIRNGIEMGYRVNNNPLLGITLVQEAPNTRKMIDLYIKAFEATITRSFKVLVATPWGILIAYDEQLFPDGLSLQGSVYCGEFASLNTRLATFKIPGFVTEISNLHLPRNQPDEALALIADSIAVRMRNKIMRGYFRYSQLFIGDWNLPPSAIEQAVKNRLDITFPNDFDIENFLTLEYNKKGHMTRGGQFRSVDHALTCGYELNPDYLQRAERYLRDMPAMSVNSQHQWGFFREEMGDERCQLVLPKATLDIA